jgi:NTE family protein
MRGVLSRMLAITVSRLPAALRSAPTVFALVLLAGCATQLPDVRIDKVDLAAGYRIETQLPTAASKDPETLLMLAFSGGGTRAAAFSYGVLEELRRTTVTVKGRPHRLVDEIDAISSVSGGTFTALAFKLYGEALFESYEQNFLKRDVQGALLRSLLNPFNWPSLLFTGYGRSDMAARYYDAILFHGTTFRDLIAKPGPLVIATSTDFTTGSRFTFTQGTFDLICSDLGSLRLSLAATASSAVPVVFDPVTLRNWGGTCGLTMPAWLTQPSFTGNVDALLLQLRVDSMLRLQQSELQPYVHLVDGGVSDNLGLRSLIDLLQVLRVEPSMRESLGLARVKRVALVVVNSLSASPPDWGRQRAGPGIIATLLQSTSVPIDHNSTDSIVMMQWMLQRWKLEAELQRLDPALVPGAPPPDMEFYPIILSFDALGDPQAREFFNSLPTTLSLPPETVDRLREAGGQLLRESAQFDRFLRSFGQAPAARRSAAD